ncbi:hypothetical protein PsorP6_013242 [Peronosclerospora sorghi]|uniref:Uncharacterized protein n=1 Tax=Peronosclerospora sorghi TaxID=230839 RepID=A0ACC0WGN8_9STRA|nr:hypothetical protein PsorP6_013242 [Peronosclerospora sorghi]
MLNDAEELKAVHGQTGTLVLDIQGQVLSAMGELCGNAGEIAAETIYSMLQDSNWVLDTSQKEELERMISRFHERHCPHWSKFSHGSLVI